MNSEINSDSDYGNSAKDETLDLTEKHVQQNTMEGRTLEVTDSNGKVISSLPVEHTNKKTSALCGIAAALGMKKRSRRSMMQMAISGELSKEQLIQIISLHRILPIKVLCPMMNCYLSMLICMRKDC